jgi:hypothetical protein
MYLYRETRVCDTYYVYTLGAGRPSMIGLILSWMGWTYFLKNDKCVGHIYMVIVKHDLLVNVNTFMSNTFF